LRITAEARVRRRNMHNAELKNLTLNKILSGHQIMELEIDAKFSIHGGDEKCIQHFKSENHKII
jgi:hypothetical protein